MSATHDERLDGEIGIDDAGRPNVRFEREFPHPVERVWSALTDSEAAARWMGGLKLETARRRRRRDERGQRPRQ